MKRLFSELGRRILQRNKPAAEAAAIPATPVVPVVLISRKTPPVIQVDFDPSHTAEQRADAILLGLVKSMSKAFTGMSLKIFFHAHDRAEPPYNAASMTIFNSGKMSAGEIGVDFVKLEDSGEPGFRLSHGSAAFGDFLPLRTITAENVHVLYESMIGKVREKLMQTAETDSKETVAAARQDSRRDATLRDATPA